MKPCSNRRRSLSVLEYSGSFLFYLLICASLNVYAAPDVVLDNDIVRLEVSSKTGRITDVSLKAVNLIENGDLLSIGFPQSPGDYSLVAQQSTTLPDDSIELISHFRAIGTADFSRKILMHRGQSLLTVFYSFITPDSSIDPLSTLWPNFVLANGMMPDTDPLGGYGEWLISYLRPFYGSSQNGMKQIDTSESIRISDGEWFGWENSRYIVAIRPEYAADTIEWKVSAGKDFEVLPSAYHLSPISNESELNQNLERKFEFSLLISPKQRDILGADDVALEGLLLRHFWGWFRWLCFGLWAIIDFIFSITGSWGATLILLALLVRLFFWPISRKSMAYQRVSLQQQQHIKPLAAEIKKNYKGLEQSEKLVQLYENENYSHLAPFKAMMGLLIQIPILIALFNVLSSTYELNGVDFFWINDLSRQDQLFVLPFAIPYFGSYFNLLPFLMAGLTVVSSFLANKYSGGEASISGASTMAGVFFVLFYSFPSALVLYWTAATGFQLIEQKLNQRLAVSAKAGKHGTKGE